MRTAHRNGFTLIATGFCIASLLGMLGLALDHGRVYIARNETQSFTDTAALAAVLKLDGKTFAAAREAVANKTKNQLNLRTGAAVTTEFATAQAANDFQPDPATWSTAPPAAAGYTFVRVTASAKLVRTSSIAGQVPIHSFTSGLLPYSPIWHRSAAAVNPPFGLVPGQWYTLRQRSGAIIKAHDVCPGDQRDPAYLAQVNAQPADLRGFYQDPSARVAKYEIINGLMTYPVTYPGTITMYGGDLQTTSDALNTRIDDDTDNTSTTYDQYVANKLDGEIVGNGFRLVGVPVNDGAPGATRNLKGIAGFFLSSSSANVYYDGTGLRPFCAEYYGTWSKDQSTQGAGKPGIAYLSMLVQ